MTIAESLTKLSTDIEAAYDAVTDKGGTVPDEKNTNNLATAIASIEGGSTPTPEPEYPYDIPEFDGGEFGAIAYLDDNNEVAYYYGTSDDDIQFGDTLAQNTSPAAISSVAATTADGRTITRAQILAVALGSTLPKKKYHLCANMVNLIHLYGLEKWTDTTIPFGFLYGCCSFNQPLTFPDHITTIRGGLLVYGYQFDSPIHWPSSLQVLGDTSVNTSYNQYYQILGSCTNFDQPIELPSGLTTLGHYFLAGCSHFNQPIVIPDGVGAIRSYFLNTCKSFNSSLTLPSNLVSIDAPFLASCYNFNQPLVLSVAGKTKG